MRITIMSIKLLLLVLLYCNNILIDVRSVLGNNPDNDHASNPPKLNSTYGAGRVEELGSLKAYVSGSIHSKRAVLIISDVFGYETPKLRDVADKVAKAGFYAVVPDFFRGDPFKRNVTSRPLEAWHKDHPPAKGFEDSKKVIEALKSKGVTRIGAAGFCWGGKVAVELSKGINFVQAEILLHPSFVSVDDIKVLKVPTSVLDAENMSSLMKQFEEALKAKPQIDSFVKVFPGVKHGWTIRYEDEDKFAVRSAEEAHKYILSWFAKHLK